MNTCNKSTLVLICFRTIIDVIKHSIRSSLPEKYFDDGELSEIVKALVTNIYTSILAINYVTTEFLSPVDQDTTDAYQQNIDYLMYCGIDQDTAFRITHHAETLILQAILDIIPDIDNKNKYVITSILLNNNDFTLIVEVKNEQSYNFNSINNSCV